MTKLREPPIVEWTAAVDPLRNPLGIVPALWRRYTGEDEWILTWNSFAIDEILWRGADRPEPCSLVPPRHFGRADGRLFVPLTGGTVNIEGITVRTRMSRRTINFVAGQRYLFVGAFCDQSVFLLTDGSVGVFTIGDAGQLLAYGDSDRLLEDDVLTYRDLPTLRAFLTAQTP